MTTLTKTRKQFKVVNLTGKTFTVKNTWEYPITEMYGADGESFDIRSAYRDTVYNSNPYDIDVSF